MAFPWKALGSAAYRGAPVMGVGATGLYGYHSANSDVNTEKVRGAGISMGLGAATIGAGIGAWKGTKAMWSSMPKKPTPKDVMNASTPKHMNRGSMTGEAWNRAKAGAGDRAFWENGPMNASTYPKASPGYRPKDLPMKIARPRGPMNIGKRVAGSIGLIGAAAGIAYTAMSMMTHKDDASNLAANISQSNASSSGFDPGEGGGYSQGERQRFIQSTEGLVQGLHRGRH
jgi:hypothetical protein